MKLIPLVFVMLLYLLLFSCMDNKTNFIRKTTEINKEVFFGIARPLKNDSLEQISKDFQQAFRLVPLENDMSQTEIRIYFLSAWRERFFREIINGDSSNLYILNCKTDRRNDSLFMTTGTIIEAKGKLVKKIFSKTSLLPKAKIWEFKNDTPVLDGGDTYFIEVKSRNEIRRVLIDNPFGKGPNDIDAQYVSDFIKIITNSYSFNFNDHWGIIDSTAFRNNFK